MKRGDGDPGLVISRREDSDLDHCAVCSCPLGVLSAKADARKTCAYASTWCSVSSRIYVVKNDEDRVLFSAHERLQDSKTPSSLLLAVGAVDSVQGRGVLKSAFSLYTCMYSTRYRS